MHHSSVISTRQYRAPEVILQLGWSEPSDIWSLGCILMELYTGRLVFSTHDSLEHLALMENIIEPFPLAVLVRASRKAKSTYLATGEEGLWWPEGARSEESLLHVAHQWNLRDLAPSEHQEFVILVKRLLTLDPSQRPEATQASTDPFFNATFTD